MAKGSGGGGRSGRSGGGTGGMSAAERRYMSNLYDLNTASGLAQARAAVDRAREVTNGGRASLSMRELVAWGNRAATNDRPLNR